MEAHAAIGPSWYPGTCIWEEAIVAFSYLAQAQQVTADPALITLEMGVIVSGFLIILVIPLVFQAIEEYVRVRGPDHVYNRLQRIVAHLGWEGFTPYQFLHTRDVDYYYSSEMRPIAM